MNAEAQMLRTAALVTAAALRGDDMAVRLLLHTLPPEQIKAACEGSVLAVAGLVREFLDEDAIQIAVREAQQIARDAVTERNRS
ncbi:hypothetical protein PV755_46560 [Streptomyces caniscabiei]|uniref:Uncharacterized protein n=1 Tax=Streptomyces caniscabiei TaxID=2746961 RepID=A0A927LJG0_9ACTN|nr:hypothetical protein [Streptomyces caniscabiei]MBD9730193.1 hypothetical protein [Streptomyces caniscabiei]MDX3516268.1 hypothetical protein [Streptomyces caniscabiei]MDX3725267.1 hypothetical protein [Streptomyces caniscabiei]WEO25168.1 hypothetical protein IHE65_19390 [Streptomyces caniscabiei]WEO26320.1 hypothetical protein IHE65_25915 [Streptomyces caniscabiei]